MGICSSTLGYVHLDPRVLSLGNPGSNFLGIGVGALEQREVNLNLPRFRLHPYAAIGWRSSSGQLARSNSSGLRYPSAECVLTLL